VKKRDDLNDVIREESSRGRKRPINTAAINEKAERRDAVLRILRRGTREDLRALLKTWDYSKEEIEAALIEYDAALGEQSS
jgi:vacuolar-type H+-ATPase subunit E/Vma4